MFITVRTLIDKLLRHPLLKDLNEEYIFDYIVEFIGIVGVPELYEEKCDTFKVEDYRVVLPETVVEIKAVRDKASKRAYISSSNRYNDDINSLTYKVQNNILYLGTRNNEIEVLYNMLSIDEEGYPKISDDPSFLRALECYIKQQAFTVLFDLGKLHPSILQNAQSEYCWAIRHYTSRKSLPTVDEMESIKNIIRGVSQYHHSSNFRNANLE